jgi:hypothetical protein
VWAPTPFRQLGNLLVNLGKEGDVRVYSEGEFRRMLAEVGFAEITRAAISPSAIVMGAAARR